MTKRSDRWTFSTSAPALVAALVATWPAAAQSPALAGTWRLQGDIGAAQAAIRQQVEPTLVALRADLQQYARARIAETTWVPHTITIATQPDRISVDYQGAEQRTFATAPGQPQNVYSRSGVRAQMTQSYRPDGAIEQRFVALDGTQFNVLTASGAHLYLDVIMESPRLTQPIRFRLVYVRA